MIKLFLPTKDLSVFYRAWQWFCLLSRTGFSTEEDWSKNSHAWCLNCSGKQLYSLCYCQWYRYLSLINISHFFLFSPQFLTGQSQGQWWSKLSWYICDCFSSWQINLSSSACSHMLTGLDFTNPFFGHSKITAF